jgi:glutathione S-transferase
MDWFTPYHAKIRECSLPVFTSTNVDQKQYVQSIKELKDLTKILDAHLNGRSFVATDYLTIADIKFAAVARLALQVLFDGGYRKAVSNFTKWFQNVASNKAFVARFGNTHLCQKSMKVAPSGLVSAQPAKAA